MNVVYAFGWNTDRIKKRHSFICGVFFILKGLFDTQKEGSQVPNYNEKGFFDNFKLCNVDFFLINVVINIS